MLTMFLILYPLLFTLWPFLCLVTFLMFFITCIISIFCYILYSTVNLVVANTPSGTNTVGEQYTLTCSASVGGTTDTPSFQWLGPDGTMIITTDSLMITDSPSSSILQFNPLQSSHEGNYACQVTVGTVTEMRSIQVNVEGKS